MAQPRIGVLELPEGLLEALGRRAQPEEPKTYAEQLATAKAAFQSRLDRALAGCPEDADPRHRAITQALATLVRTVFKVDILPEPVADTVVRLLVYDAIHSDDLAEGIKHMLGGTVVMDAILVAGAVLRVKDLPDTTGVARTDGHGQYL